MKRREPARRHIVVQTAWKEISDSTSEKVKERGRNWRMEEGEAGGRGRDERRKE